MPRNEKLRRHPELVSIAASLIGEASKVDHAEADLVPFFRAFDHAYAANLNALGLAAGDRIASLLPNCGALFIHYLGAFKVVSSRYR